MKPFTLLILTFILTVHVSADITEYIRAVSLANRLMSLAAEVENDEIRSKNVGNGLEYVIKSIACENFHTLDSMNYMIAIPDFAPLNNEREITEAIGYQRQMGIEISQDLKIPVEKATKKKYNFEVLDRNYLKELAEERRRLTGTALKNIIRSVIDFENMAKLIEERRIHTSENLTNRITYASDRYEHGISLLGICRLIALLMTIQLPSSNKKDYKTGINNTCLVWDGASVKVYREIEGTWWQVSFNDINNRKQSLKAQLDEF